MSTLNRLAFLTKRTVKKISDTTEELIDSAAEAIKVKNLEFKIEELYAELGRIVYRDLHTDEDLEDQKLQVIAEIDALYDRLALLKEAADEGCEKVEIVDAFAPAAQDGPIDAKFESEE